MTSSNGIHFMNAQELEAARDLMLEAAREAGEILLSYYGRLDRARIGRKSSVRDLVTEADVASERHLVQRLRKALPTHAIEAEEEVQDALGDRSQPRWFLDPLDGTVNFVHSLPMFAVSAGLWIDDQPKVAVVHLPVLGETFHAIHGAGAFLGKAPIAVSSTSLLSEAILATGFPYRRNELAHDNLDNFNAFFYEQRGIRRMGSAAIDLAYTAAGRLDGYWELHLSPHDVAAGGLLVQEAGGRVTDAEGGTDWLRGGSVVAAGPALHEAIRERLVH